MRAIIFRVLAGLLAVAFLVLLLAGDRSKMSLRQQVGGGVVAVGFAIYALLGTDHGERLIGFAFGGRNPRSGGRSASDKRGEPDARQEQRPS